MPHLRPIKTVEGGGGVEQRRQQILFDVSDFASAALQAVKHILDMVIGQCQESLPHQFHRILLARNLKVIALRGQHLRHQGNDVVDFFPGVLLHQNIVFDLFTNMGKQLYCA